MSDSKVIAATSQPVEDDKLADIPDISTFLATSDTDRIAGLKLVADSIAQQRQFASKAIIKHAYVQAGVLAVLAILANVLVKTNTIGDWAVFGTTAAGVIMALLVGVRYLVSPFVAQAEGLNYDWLGHDTVILTKFGDTVIGAAVVGWEDLEKKGRKKKGGFGVLRAWTVLLRYRGKGEGRVLLEEAVKLTKEKAAEGLIFEKDGICKFLRMQMMVGS
jgi:hypothetical protein